MVKKKRRCKVSLTLNPDVWARCKEKGEKYDLNWSQVAEEAFLAVLLQLEQVENIVESVPPDLEASVVKSKLKNYINDLQSQVNRQVHQELETQIPD